MLGRSTPEKLRARAEELERKGKRDKALEAYQQLAESEPTDPDLWILLGEKEIAIGEPARAAQAFFRATDLLLRGGLFQEAAEMCQKSLAADRGFGPARRLQGIIEKRLRRMSGEEEPEPPPAPPKVIIADAPPEPEPAPEPAPPPAPAEVVMEAEEPPPDAPPHDEPELTIEATGDAERGLSAPLDQLILAERFVSESAAQAAEITLDEVPPDPLEPQPLRVRSVSPLSSPLLGAMDNAVLQVLIEHAVHERRAAGDVIFKQGDPGDRLFVILRGEVNVLRDVGEPEPRRLATLRAGSFFGEMALLTAEPRNATVIAAEECELLAVARPHVQRLIDTDREVLRTLLRFFRARLVGTLVQTAPLFRGLSLLERRTLVARFRLREIQPGAVVIREGQPSDGLCIVLAGHLAVSHRNGGQDRLIARLGGGDIFGEMSLLTGGPAVATIRAETKVWALALPRRDFEQAITARPQMRAMLDRLAQERRAKNDAIRRGEATYSEGRVEPLS
jgi:CRP-like cAMP-binding protein